MEWSEFRRRQERERRHSELLEEQRRQHDEQLAAISRKSQREAELDRRQASINAVMSDLQSRTANLDKHYQEKWQKLEAEIPGRVDAGIKARMKEVDEHKSNAHRVLAGWADKLYGKAVEQYEKKQKLKEWYIDLRSWQDKMNAWNGHFMGTCPDPEAEERLTDRQEVEQAVTAAVEELKH